jgi:drug/metabolite transporter (DMT)-like permease
MAEITTRPAIDPAVRRQGLLVAGAALVTVCLWASAFVGIRSAGRDLSPGALALGRLLVGSLALGVVVVVRREGLPSRQSLRGIALAGVLWFGIYMVVLNAAERRIDGGTASMIVNLGPILIAIFAGLFLHEGFPRKLLVGCAVAFAGGALIGVATSEHSPHAGWGAVLCVVAAFAYAGGVVAQKPALRHASAVQVTWAACTLAAILCLPFLPQLIRETGDAHGSAIGWTIYLGVMPTAVGFLTWAYALSRTTAGKMGSTTYLVAPIAILLGWTILGETPPVLAIPGGILCLAGVAISRR